MALADSIRRFPYLALLALVPLLAACAGTDDFNPPPPTATATLSQGPTATATGGVPTSTATEALTATASATATLTLTPLSTATATATATGTTAATVTATPTGTPTGTTAATITPTPTPVPEGFRDVASAQPAAFAAHGSVDQVYVTDADPNTLLELVGADSFVVMAGTTDAKGSLLLRQVPVGAGYHVVAGYPGPLVASGALDVSAWDDPPDASFYEEQTIASGYGYLKTRDGTLLAINGLSARPARPGPVSDRDRVLRLRSRQPRLAAAEHPHHQRRSVTLPSA